MILLLLFDNISICTSVGNKTIGLGAHKVEYSMGNKNWEYFLVELLFWNAVGTGQ